MGTKTSVVGLSLRNPWPVLGPATTLDDLLPSYQTTKAAKRGVHVLHGSGQLIATYISRSESKSDDVEVLRIAADELGQKFLEIRSCTPTLVSGTKGILAGAVIPGLFRSGLPLGLQLHLLA
jgi:hypothetical protein